MMRKAGLWLGVVALVAGTCGANAQPSADAYPNQTVRIVVPFSAGSITDGLARVLADELAKAWDRQSSRTNRRGIRQDSSARAVLSRRELFKQSRQSSFR